MFQTNILSHNHAVYQITHHLYKIHSKTISPSVFLDVILLFSCVQRLCSKNTVNHTYELSFTSVCEETFYFFYSFIVCMFCIK